jgi:hypothetical protein
MLYESSYTETHHKDVNMHSFEFTVPDVMGNNMPVFLEVEATEGVEIYVLNKDDYNDALEIDDIRNLSINKNSGKITRYSYTDNFEPGNYIIISYLRFDTDKDISITYNITRFVLLPVLWLISLIFIILILICLLRIFLLRRKKSQLYAEHQARRNQSMRDEYYAGDQGDYDYYDDGQGYDYPPQPGYSDYGSDAPPPRQRPGPPRRPPPPQQRRRRPPPGPRGDGYYQQDSGYVPPSRSSQGPGPKPVTIPCKCGEVIVVSDPTRPLQIQCQRCGRRGILEAADKSPHDDIFY